MLSQSYRSMLIIVKNIMFMSWHKFYYLPIPTTHLHVKSCLKKKKIVKILYQVYCFNVVARDIRAD